MSHAGLTRAAKEILETLAEGSNCELVPTMSGYERHPRERVGRLWRIKDPSSVKVGHCKLKQPLAKGDLFLCLRHSGDFFQDYMFVEETPQGYQGRPDHQFGSYGIGDAEPVDIHPGMVEVLKAGNLALVDAID